MAGLGIDTNEQIQIALSAIGHLYKTGYYTFKDMMLVVKERGVDFILDRSRQNLFELAYDPYQ